jgi:hypothetical protein
MTASELCAAALQRRLGSTVGLKTAGQALTQAALAQRRAESLPMMFDFISARTKTFLYVKLSPSCTGSQLNLLSSTARPETRKVGLQMRFIQDLSPETCHLLHKLYKQSKHHRVRQRAHCIFLSFQGITTTALMAIFSVDRITIYNWFDAWEAHHFAGLYDKKGRGRPPKLTEEEQCQAQHYLEQYPRDVKKVHR